MYPDDLGKKTLTSNVLDSRKNQSLYPDSNIFCCGSFEKKSKEFKSVNILKSMVANKESEGVSLPSVAKTPVNECGSVDIFSGKKQESIVGLNTLLARTFLPIYGYPYWHPVGDLLQKDLYRKRKSTFPTETRVRQEDIPLHYNFRARNGWSIGNSTPSTRTAIGPREGVVKVRGEMFAPGSSSLDFRTDAPDKKSYNDRYFKQASCTAWNVDGSFVATNSHCRPGISKSSFQGIGWDTTCRRGWNAASKNMYVNVRFGSVHTEHSLFYPPYNYKSVKDRLDYSMPNEYLMDRLISIWGIGEGSVLVDDNNKYPISVGNRMIIENREASRDENPYLSDFFQFKSKFWPCGLKRIFFAKTYNCTDLDFYQCEEKEASFILKEDSGKQITTKVKFDQSDLWGNLSIMGKERFSLEKGEHIYSISKRPYHPALSGGSSNCYTLERIKQNVLAPNGVIESRVDNGNKYYAKVWTEPGSSGSPVFDYGDNKVFAILSGHHLGQGTSVHTIPEEAKSYIKVKKKLSLLNESHNYILKTKSDINGDSYYTSFVGKDTGKRVTLSSDLKKDNRMIAGLTTSRYDYYGRDIGVLGTLGIVSLPPSLENKRFFSMAQVKTTTSRNLRFLNGMSGRVKENQSYDLSYFMNNVYFDAPKFATFYNSPEYPVDVQLCPPGFLLRGIEVVENESTGILGINKLFCGNPKTKQTYNRRTVPSFDTNLSLNSTLRMDAHIQNYVYGKKIRFGNVKRKVCKPGYFIESIEVSTDGSMVLGVRLKCRKL